MADGREHMTEGRSEGVLRDAPYLPRLARTGFCHGSSAICPFAASPLPARRSMRPEHGDVLHVQQLAAAVVHVDAAGQAGIEAAHGAHDIDALELVGSVLL